MPLTGSVSDRIRELVHHGTKKRTHKEIVAIAINSKERDSGKKSRLQELVEDYFTRKKKETEKPREPVKLDAETIREAIRKAAERVHPSPTDPQRKAGNYRMGHIKVHGMDITIESPVGAVRKGKGKDGPWEVLMKHHYGYIKRTESEADKDHVDVFVGPHPDSEIVFVIDQNIGGKFDEHKCMVGFTNAEEAKKAYHDNYSAGWEGFANIRALTVDQFKKWVKKGNTHIPIYRQVLVFNSEPVKLKKEPSYDQPLKTIEKEGKDPPTPTVDTTVPSTSKPTRPLPQWVPQENPNAKDPSKTGWIPVISSWIAGLKYTRDRGAEMVVKKGGKSYPYAGINLDMFRRWVAAKSKGKWWWRNIGYPMQGQPHQFSRFTGVVHQLFGPGIDRRPDYRQHFGGYTFPQLQEWFQRHVHPQITDAHIGALTGWVPGATLTATKEGPIGYGHYLAGHEPTDLTFNVHAPGYSTSRTIFSRNVNQEGVPYIKNEYMEILPEIRNWDYSTFPKTFTTSPNPFRGLSGPVLLRQIRAAHELGIPRIGWLAAHGGESASGAFNPFTGGWHWPMLGADGIVPNFHEAPPEVLEEANQMSNGRFAQTRLFSDFFQSPKAKQWYSENPESHSAFVDTTPGSYSRREIERHVGENAAKRGFEAPTPDASMMAQPMPREEKPYSPPQEASLHMHMFVPHYHLHPALLHLHDTGSLHPDFFDEYFNK